jgi:hypothetical protein
MSPLSMNLLFVAHARVYTGPVAVLQDEIPHLEAIAIAALKTEPLRGAAV